MALLQWPMPVNPLPALAILTPSTLRSVIGSNGTLSFWNELTPPRTWQITSPSASPAFYFTAMWIILWVMFLRPILHYLNLGIHPTLRLRPPRKFVVTQPRGLIVSCMKICFIEIEKVSLSIPLGIIFLRFHFYRYGIVGGVRFPYID